MKNQKYFPIILGILTVVLVIALMGCTSTVTPVSQGLPDQSDVQNAPAAPALAAPDAESRLADNQLNTSIDPVNLESQLAAASDLSSEEIAGLLLMREEEKLAHDVYIALYEKWDLKIFLNIANSEQSHTDAVKGLLDAYGLEDPAAEMPGEFANAELQALYDELTTQGSQSLSDALKVGAAIEEIDILDLEKLLAQTENADIQVVYENLLKGSQNHLRAFSSTLSQQTGETYEPQYLSTDVYQSIIGSATESGNRRKGNRS
jgi:hypothetical protein